MDGPMRVEQLRPVTLLQRAEHVPRDGPVHLGDEQQHALVPELRLEPPPVALRDVGRGEEAVWSQEWCSSTSSSASREDRVEIGGRHVADDRSWHYLSTRS